MLVLLVEALPELLLDPQPGLVYEGDGGADLVLCMRVAHNIGPRGSAHITTIM